MKASCEITKYAVIPECSPRRIRPVADLNRESSIARRKAKTWIPAFAGMTTSAPFPMSYRKILITAIILASGIFPLNNIEAALKTGGHVKASLVLENQSIQPGQPFWVAIRLEMDDKWHTYWKNPGESGAPTKIKWTLPAGFTTDPFLWPTPQRIEFPPLVSYGYEKEVWFLTQIKASAKLKPGQTFPIIADVDWLECSEVCIPGKARVQESITIQEAAPRPNKILGPGFSKARAALPLTQSDWTVKAFSQPKRFQIEFQPPTWFNEKLNSVYFFSEQLTIVNHSAKQNLTYSKGIYTLTIEQSDAMETMPSHLTGILWTESGWRGKGSEQGLEINVPFSTSSTPSQTAHTSIVWAILAAFLGGIILNLMPCVLPILSIKVLGFLNQAGGEKSIAIKHALYFTLGILSSFWVLAGALFFLRAGGNQLGWGFQMQSPPFVFFLISLFFLLALNLFGVFEIGTSFTKLGSLSTGHGSFFSGILTTLVATPCTAPFMGSALGFAFSQPFRVAFLIFSSLGLGVAAPYVLLSNFPQMLRYVPKPGPWMDHLKKMMGFLLVATVIWLLWVLSFTKDSTTLLTVLLLLLFQGIGSWILGTWGQQINASIGKKVAWLISLALLFGSLYFGLRMMAQTQNVASAQPGKIGKISWEPFSKEKVQSLRQAGQPVFLDFTAAWCLTCQVNERVALSSPEVINTFKEKNVALLKADWTSYDSNITESLQSFGRSGVPLYVLYSADPTKAPQILPEIITPQIVLKALSTL